MLHLDTLMGVVQVVPVEQTMQTVTVIFRVTHLTIAVQISEILAAIHVSISTSLNCHNDVLCIYEDIVCR